MINKKFFIVPFLSITLSNCSPAEEKIIEYNVNIELNHASSTYSKIAKNNINYCASIYPYNKYLLSRNNINVNINNIDITNFIFSNNKLLIPKEEIKGNINVIVTASFNENITKYEKEREDYLKDSTISDSLKISFDMLSGFELELMSNNYSNSALNNIICFREDAYNDTEWSIIAGNSSSTIKSLYNSYKNSFTKERWISKGNNIIDNESNKIDFYHLLAVLNTYLYSNNQSKRDLASFGGDIVQYVAYGSSYFSNEDLLADIDGANLYYYYKKNKYYKTVSGISLAYIHYYINNSLENRMKIFVENELDGSLSYEDQVNELFSRLSNNLYLIILCEKYGISFTSKENEFKDAIKYFLDNIGYKKENINNK